MNSWRKLVALATLLLPAGCLLPGDPVFEARDAEAPILVQSLPFDGALRVPPDALILLSFSEPLAAGQPTPAQIDLRSGELVVPVSIDHPRPGLVRLTPAAALNRGLRYHLGLANSLSDAAFNPLAAESARTLLFTITTADDSLQVVSTEPAEGALDAQARPTIRLTFDVPLSPLSLDRSQVILADAAGAAVGLRVVISASDARVLEVSPFGALAPGSEHTLTISAELRDVQSRHLAVPFELRFTTGP